MFAFVIEEIVPHHTAGVMRGAACYEYRITGMARHFIARRARSTATLSTIITLYSSSIRFTAAGTARTEYIEE